MFSSTSPRAIAGRFASVAETIIADSPADRQERSRRALLEAVAGAEPATLNDVAAALGRGAPAVSRSVETLVRSGLIERSADPANRRRLAMRLTDAGREVLRRPGPAGDRLAERFGRFAPSELRAIERALEILERAT